MKIFFLLIFTLLFFTACSPSSESEGIENNENSDKHKEARGVKEEALETGPDLTQNRL